MCLQAFSQNFRKSIQCLLWKQRDKSEIKYLKNQALKTTTPEGVKPNLLLLILSLFAYSCWEDSYEDDSNNDHYCDFIQCLLIISSTMDSLRIDRSEN